ncbi:MAG: hypothetical protein IJP29_00100 [Lachnospiraceae bacterium]|nr:hypothetical protein [Lachnospiraceae bacterium]
MDIRQMDFHASMNPLGSVLTQKEPILVYISWMWQKALPNATLIGSFFHFYK